MVFLSSLCRETAKKRDKKIEEKKIQETSFVSLNFFVKKFLTCISPQIFFLVFLNSPCSETHKHAIKTINLLIKKRNLPTSFSGYLPDIRRFQKNLQRPLRAGTRSL
jgi:hypothetical protein